MTTTSSSGGGGDEHHEQQQQQQQQDDEVFEINDFTVVTALESFIVGIETAIYCWGLERKKSLGSNNNNNNNNRFIFNRSQISICKWDSKSTKVIYGDNNALNLTYYWPKTLKRMEEVKRSSSIDEQSSSSSSSSLCVNSNANYMTNAAELLMATELDFCAESIIANQFGVLEFLLLTPFSWSVDEVVNESQLNTILSAVTIALTNTDCEMPVFVQYGDINRYLYFGVCQNHSVRTHFESVHLKRIQSVHNHLSGLIELFTDKVKCSLMDTHNIRVSVRIDYQLKEPIDVMPHFSSTFAQMDGVATPNELFVANIPRLPFGAASDILDVFTLHATWPNLRQETLNENDVYSDLDPLAAPFWSASVLFLDGAPCLMNLGLKTLMETASGREAQLHLSGILGVAADDERSLAATALSSIAEPRTLSITDPTGSIEDSTAISMADLMRWISAIFAMDTGSCDSSSISLSLESRSASSATRVVNDERISSSAPGEAVKEPSPVPSSRLEYEEHGEQKSMRSNCMKILEHSKAAPLNSLASRIATSLLYILCHHEAGTTAFAQLWIAFVRELRARWESSELLPGVEPDAIPDLSMSFLQQKLQMLQSCIGARCKRHKWLDERASTSDLSMFSNDEFQDAKEWLSDDENSDNDNDSTNRSESLKIATRNTEESCPQNTTTTTTARGRLKSLAPLCLVDCPQEVMFEPLTQERCPLTEDMLERQLSKLTELDNAEARARAHLDSLLSDMQAFKAANPGCIFDDFVRWHSPRDYIVDEETGKGCLSSRMSDENNTWRETWREAMPIPVMLQKRLFNETKEAELILQEFSGVTVADLCELIIPIVLNCATMQLVDECRPIMSIIGEKLHETCEKVSRCSRKREPEEYLDVIRELHIIETTIAKYNSLWTRFTMVDENLVNNEALASEVRVFVKTLVSLSKRDPQTNLLSGGTKAGIAHSVNVDGGVDGALGCLIKKLFATDDRCARDDANANANTSSPSSKRRVTDETKGEASKKYATKYRMPPYHRRQYVLHWLGSRGGNAPRSTANRMYASLSADESRICMSYTEDIVFR